MQADAGGMRSISIDWRPTSEDAPVIKIVNLILVQAIKEKASDIHIEPFQRTLRLRYRIDGELIQAESPPKALQLAITSRIKILAGLNIAERRVPQDGRFRIKVVGKEVDLRISILPTAYGEKIVIRILDKTALPEASIRWAWTRDARQIQESDRCAARNDPRDRSDWFRKDDHALFGAPGTKQPGIQHRHRRGPDRIRARWESIRLRSATKSGSISPRPCAPSCARIRTS